MATCVDVGKADYPRKFGGKEIIPLEGKSLAPVFRGETRKPHELLAWEWCGNRAIRQGKWKCVWDKMVKRRGEPATCVLQHHNPLSDRGRIRWRLRRPQLKEKLLDVISPSAIQFERSGHNKTRLANREPPLVEEIWHVTSYRITATIA